MSQSQLRLHIFAGLMLLCLLTLVGRLWMLQLANWGVYAQAAAGNRTSVSYSPAPRGLILDTRGRILAENRPVWRVSIVPLKFPRDETQRERVIGKLAGILQQPMPLLRERIKEASARRGEDAVPLQDVGHDVPFEVVANILEQSLEMPGVTITETSVRNYPQGPLAGHLLGYARAISESEYEKVKQLQYPRLGEESTGSNLPLPVERRDPLYSRDSTYGQAGVEKQYEIGLHLSPPLPILSGRRGRTVYEVDATLNRVRLIEHRPATVGASVYLTLDAELQRIMEQSLAAAIAGKRNRTATGVVLEARTGAVLALASLPNYDPNDWVKKLKPEVWRRLSSDPRHPLLNKAVAGLYPPASTFKIISTAAAMETGKGSARKTYVCTGAIHEGPQRFKCWKLNGHGGLDFPGAMAQSCDVYFYELVRKANLTADEIAQYARLFGFGEQTGIDLPEEAHVNTLVPTPAWKMDLKRERWWTGDSLNTIIGQGAITSTPLQVALAFAAVANGGDLLQPHVVRKIVWPSHMKLPPTVVEPRIRRHIELKPETWKVIRDGLRLAVAGEHGTGRVVADLPVRVAGKTGSAQHITDRPTHAWFICYAPESDPKYVVAVFVSEGGHGGATAAPIARRLLVHLFNLEKTAAAQQTIVPSD
jgi:penicillin-binding protein 2